VPPPQNVDELAETLPEAGVPEQNEVAVPVNPPSELTRFVPPEPEPPLITTFTYMLGWLLHAAGRVTVFTAQVVFTV
jgi:hypothetical protein